MCQIAGKYSVLFTSVLVKRLFLVLLFSVQIHFYGLFMGINNMALIVIYKGNSFTKELE